MSDQLQILNPWMLEKLTRGECILFLGAGAAFGGIGNLGEKPLTGLQLRDKISETFLGNSHKDKPLTRVAEFAKYESSMLDLQSYIRDLFLPIYPAEFHKLIPTFRWHAIVTTNYDLIIERAYDATTARQQQLRPIIKDGDNFSTVLKANDTVPYLKLHGCINTINDEGLPLILGSEEYAKFQQNRKRLFRHFADWAKEHPIIFIGYDISDPNIQQILFDLTDKDVNRPIYGIVDPALDSISSRYWSAHRFIPVAMTAESFLRSINQLIPQSNRTIASLSLPNDISIKKWFSTNLQPSSLITRYLNEEILHIHSSMKFDGVRPRDFYNGKTTDWSSFQQKLDFERRITDDLLLEIVLTDTNSKSCTINLVKGHAGSGKTVVLKRFAWDAATAFDAKVIYLQEGAVLRNAAIIEISELTKESIIIIIDDAIRHIPDIIKLKNEADAKQLSIKIVISARTNEWNHSNYANELLISEEYELKSLSEWEIENLLHKLETHGALGELSSLSRIQQRERFNLHSDRQLLVALHEATTSKPFERLVYDEYEHVRPAEAKVLYLDICTLHRLGVPVRAGLISRVTGITFEYFSKVFFNPLEHVVYTYFDSSSRDYVYRSRHSLIANFVFEQALPDPIERAAQITRIIKHMDIDYESDSVAFSQLIKGRILSELFADKALVKQIFDAALESGAAPAYVFHQKATFELNHPGGSMQNALADINEAEKNSTGTLRDKSIEHTKAVILRKLALECDHPLERDKHRTDAKLILRRQQNTSKHSYSYDTYGRILLDELKDQISRGTDSPATKELFDRSISENIREIEECLSVGLQKFPGDDHLLTLDSDLANLLQDSPRTLMSLQAAYHSNPARAFIAVRLANTYKNQSKNPEALSVLRACLQLNPSSKECHLKIAQLLMDESELNNRQEIQHHLKRSFTEGDTNFDAQFWNARHEMLYGDKESGISHFARLASAKTDPTYKKRIRGPVLNADKTITIFSGYVKHKSLGYCFATTAELRFNIFISANQMSQTDWENLQEGSKISFNVYFTFKGPMGISMSTIK